MHARNNPQIQSRERVRDLGEVLTNSREVTAMLDLLPAEVWRNPDLKWLNPASKSGGILREIARRLMDGLESWEPDEEKRRTHILQNMVWGIGITEICVLLSRRSLYCSTHANSDNSNCKFAAEEGNIFFDHTNHTFHGGSCLFCGTPEKNEYVDDVKQEIHAYQFIHDHLPEALKSMKIDIIVMNPPPTNLKTIVGQAVERVPSTTPSFKKRRTSLNT